MIREDPTKLDARLERALSLSQLPAFTAGSRGILDLLGVTRRGQLSSDRTEGLRGYSAVDPGRGLLAPCPAHQREGDFERYGTFPAIELDSQPPQVWLGCRRDSSFIQPTEIC